MKGRGNGKTESETDRLILTAEEGFGRRPKLIGGAGKGVRSKPMKNQLNFEPKLPLSEDIDAKIEEAGLDALEYNKRWGLYKLRLTKRGHKGKGRCS